MSDFSLYQAQWLIAYDIANDATRAQFCRQLRKLAHNYQKSFFEVRANEALMQEIARELSDLINPQQDKLVIAATTKTIKTWRVGGKASFLGNNILVFS